ncbi:flagellar biosynthesis protein FlhF [Flavobacterium sp. MXW15]|uniref:Flagellar biosynthesis protein FlhF n=1 Tax=Xanthomonas chitinilytica TaxID=2989819 RepID=A0ABT3JVZ3_9XANT|nr:flagellar biosynthesis protein FlhF [Xanthomonas sp. H13-6]MCW4455189.1 flagellar biosynthesis protein FlhF [Flavobacterium sp. MXW15]MCW4472642.1 flagellar biosynthesis protein FlhF [Xanthomonas sp. H13-6]
MKIKRFVASDMRTAMNMVRKEHGPDAVILSNRRIEEGIEIVAAAHYDESVVQRALEAARPTPPAAPKPRSAAEAMIAAVTRRKAPEPEPVAPTTSAVAALARAAVGATGRTIESAHELGNGIGSRFASLVKPRPEAHPALSTQSFATLPSTDEEPPALPPARAAAVAAAAPINRARFVIDPPLEEMPLMPMASRAAAAAPARPQPAPAAIPAPAVFAPPAAQEPAPAIAMPSPALSALHTEVPAREVRVPAEAVEATPAPVAAAAPAPQAAALSVVPVATQRDDEQIAQLRQEVAGMRQMIEREMNRFTDERLRGCPVRANALDLMDEYGFDAGLSRDVAMAMPADTEAHRARGLMLGLISKKLPIAPVDPIESGGVIALVGPTGAGKTTTIAKLASRFAEAHAARDVALVTTDTQRIGAREQLYGFGRQLGIAVHEANSGTNLSQLLDRLADYKLVLIDTAGLGQRDRALAAQLQWLRAAGQIRTLLVLPANTSFQDMDEVVRRFGAANPQGVVLTKLDETGRFGSALSVAVDHRLPITWVTDGQDVPEDLHRASAANLVLRLEDLRRAADMPCNPELNHAVA